MTRACGGIALAAALLGSAGCNLPGAEPAERQVVIEGVIVKGETFRIDPLESIPRPADRLERARVRFEPETGSPVEVEVMGDGRFRLGPITVRPGREDRLLFSAPGRRGLSLTDPLHTAAAGGTGAGEGPVTLRWRVELPPLRPERRTPSA